MKGGLPAATPLSVAGGSPPIGGRGWRRAIPDHLWGGSPATPAVGVARRPPLDPARGGLAIPCSGVACEPPRRHLGWPRATPASSGVAARHPGVIWGGRAPPLAGSRGGSRPPQMTPGWRAATPDDAGVARGHPHEQGWLAGHP
jgi:hypothetical protein